MKKFEFFLLFTLLFVAPFIAAAANPTDYDLGTDDPEGQETSKTEDPSAIKGFAGVVKQVAYDGPKEFVKETAEETTKKPPIVSVVEGVNKGTQKLLDNTVKGAYKVATLGRGELESYEVQEPEKGSGEPTKIKISIPGT